MTLQIVKGNPVFKIDENGFELKDKGRVQNGYGKFYEVKDCPDGLLELGKLEDFQKYVSNAVVLEYVSSIITDDMLGTEFTVNVMGKDFLINYNV